MLPLLDNGNITKSVMYDLKVIQYENGTTEIRKYHEPILCVDDEDEKKRRVEKRKRSIEELKEELEYLREEKAILNPFSEKEEMCADLDDMKTADALERMKKERSVRNSLKRSKNEIFTLARQCKWEYFVTLTFNEKCVDRLDFDACMKKARQWCNNQHKRYANGLQYLFVPEQHKKGGWHIHGLFARVGNITFVDSGHKTQKGQTVYNVGGWRYGFSTAIKVYDTHGISGYITKYVTKDLCEDMQGKRRYFRSNNISKPLVVELLVGDYDEQTQVELVDEITQGMECTHVKNVEGYNPITYMYFNHINEEREEKENERNKMCD